ncbi:hypothetical protein RRF57_010273 [Xylaria bambusicola]|uniref:Uncharacterized protein n=1 Tax=Xylaria bambusicola TaxID=326684 RepID=A0AAN7UL02_9PEZI
MGLHRVAYIDKEDPAFSRKSYIDGVAYVLMALPEDLSDREVASIREALPPSMSDLDLVDEADGRAIGWKSAPGSRTVLQRCVAITVALSVVFIHTILSYASIVVSVGAYYERKHNISEQILSKGFVIASAVGRHSVFLSAKICAMKDGPVGKAISNMATRTVESVASGIQEGIGQGLMMSDTRPGRR